MDTIANLLTIIRNGYMVRKPEVVAPYSKMAKSILDILLRENFLESVRISKVGNFPKLEIHLQYQDGKPAITNIWRVSKPGRRVYRKAGNLPKTLSGKGATIVSTPAGVMTDKAAFRKKLGGEVVCQVW